MQPFASQHTESFAGFLRKAGVSLAVSTYEAGQLVLLRPQEQGANTHFMPMRKPMGIAVDGGTRLSVGDAHRVETFRNLPAVGEKIAPGRHDAVYLHRATHVTGDIDIHEMGYDADGELWLINTRMSCLCTLAADSSIVPRWKPPFISHYDLLDRCHLNGLGFRNGRPRYVSMLGHGNAPGSWRRDKASSGQIMDIEDDSIVVDGLCMPHSPRWYRDRLWFLASGEGCLKRVDDHGKISTVVELPGFTRGLAFVGRHALIGLSKVRESAIFAGLPLTERVSERHCGIYLVDIEAGCVVGFLKFIGDMHEIFDVQLLPHRSPTVLDSSSPLLASSFELPVESLHLIAPADPLQEALAEALRLHAGGELEQAMAAYRTIVDQHPQQVEARQQLGRCLFDAEQWRDAIGMLESALALHPANADVLNRLGLCHSRIGDQDSALEYLQRALQVDSQFALAHFNRALILLKLGRFAEAWAEYEWRWQLPGFRPFRSPQPQWQGEDITNRRLLVHSEQGDGDHIQFWRYLRLARARCRELIYVGPDHLVELAASVDGIDESRGPGDIARDRFDCFVPLMSLPLRLGLPDPLPMTAPYVRIAQHAKAHPLPGDRRIGLVWKDGAMHKNERDHSMTLEQMLPLVQARGAEYFSLQMSVTGGEVERLKAHGVTHLEPEMRTGLRTAAFVEQLDLVITVDTAIAHLAGAMGKPVWILLGGDSHWRWGMTGQSSAWYPSARLFRKAAGESWPALVARVAVALATAD
ncbi:TIGR03032 family protein [Dokdonella sp.]|uniref:TIGR03032 family protein n=1 Tax=Dokdonella sp. TaxID=2291710 RepID=UPI0035272CCD